MTSIFVRSRNHLLVAACTILSVGAAGLVFAPATYGQPPGHEKDAGAPDDERDPCDHLPDPPGKARGIEKRCRAEGSSSGIARGDFNGDGFADLAVGVPQKNTPASVTDSGAVIVIYGSSTGLLPAGGSGVPASQFWSQNTGGADVPDVSEAGDNFGAALAAGDFNGDTFSDLAIGVPGDKVVRAGVGLVGQVTVIYGSSVGLSVDPATRVRTAQRFTGGDVGLSTGFSADTEEDIAGSQRFGAALAWGDFDGDGAGDLAIGIPDQLLGDIATGVVAAGAVGVLYGVKATATDPNGLTNATGEFWTQNSDGIQGSAEVRDRFGTTLAAGDFDGDGSSDLVIGVPFEDLTFQSVDHLDVGGVHVLFGSEDRLTASDDRFVSHGSFFPGLPVPALPDDDDRFGSALATGDFDNDGRDDLAIGVALKDVDDKQNAGAVFVQYSSESPLTGRKQFWEQDRIFGEDADPFFESTTEAEDRFGFSIAAGDFNFDSLDDLAIGVPLEDVLVDRGTFFETISNAGEVDVVYGSADGLSISGRAPQSFHQATINIEDAAETNDQFGSRLSAWNFGRNETVPNPFPFPPATFTLRATDLAIGVPLEDVGGVHNTGAVNVIYGDAGSGLTSANDQFFHQGLADVAGENVDSDFFGVSLY